MTNRALQLMDGIMRFYESSTSPYPEEQRNDMLNQLLHIIPNMAPGMKKEFDDFVQWFGIQKYGLSGTTEDMLRKMHPWQLQLVVQRFNLPATSPAGTPGI